MALDKVKQQYDKYAPRDNAFYRDHYHHVIMAMIASFGIMLLAVAVLLYQTLYRPLPAFRAVKADKQVMKLVPFIEPNLLPGTLLRWSSKAAIAAYTFDFNLYGKQLAAVRPYFTDAGWEDFSRSINPLIETIRQNQLFVYGVVTGVPVISNQGSLPGSGQAWRVQIPFLVSYTSANKTDTRKFYVAMTLIRVPTRQNPQGVGIDQFVMSSRR